MLILINLLNGYPNKKLNKQGNLIARAVRFFLDKFTQEEELTCSKGCPFPIFGARIFCSVKRCCAPFQFIHILVWSIASVGFEALAVTFSVFQYYGWQLTYSFPVYLLTFGLNTLLYTLAKKHYKNWQPQ